MEELIIKNIENFSIEQIAESGQAFRWNKYNDTYTGVVNGVILNITQNNKEVIIHGKDVLKNKTVWEDYFDLNRDYQKVIEELKGKDIHLDSAIEYGIGIRMLNQDLWEMIISFIISGNNNIPRIKKSIEMLSKKYGKSLGTLNDKEYFAFPTPEELSKASVEELRECGVGYRDKYIYKTTQAINNKEVLLENVKKMNLDDARKELKKLTGVGDKVADCILLFSCDQMSAFPVDTWVKKILVDYYSVKKTSVKEVNKFALDYFGSNCGIAQQYLFFYIRSQE